MVILALVIAALALCVAGGALVEACRWYRPRLLQGEPLEAKMGAVLQTLGHSAPWTATGSNVQLVSSGARVLLGCAVAETAAGTAKIRIRDGNSASAPVRFVATFAASGSLDTFFPDEGIEITSGQIYLETASGQTEGVAYWG